MKIERIKTVLILALAFGLAFSLLSGGKPASRSVVLAQSASPRQDLVSRFRLDVDNMQAAMEDFQVASHAKTDGNITFASGDMTGSNSGIAAADLTQAIVDMTTIYNAIRSGGTLVTGNWVNVQKIR